MVGDHPTAYVGQPGFDFIQRVPTWWDETRVPVAVPGSHLVTVRRKGRSWFIGGLSSGPAHPIVVPLDFLPRGRHRLRLWSDSPDSQSDPNQLRIEESQVTRARTIQVGVSEDGGFVAELTPLP
jgi:alpha-glucosidase